MTGRPTLYDPEVTPDLATAYTHDGMIDVEIVALLIDDES
jgi:allophanate hydrolase subunit 1